MRSLSFARADGPLRVLCLGAHSDDIEIGCGGTLMTLLAGNPDVEVRWIVFGGAGRREHEARESAAVVLERARDKTVEVFGFSDSFFPYEGAAIKKRFEAMKAGFDPHVILTHRGDDRHQDHRVVSELTWNTYRHHAIFEYEVPKYDGDLGNPNVFVPITDDVRDRKIQLLMQMFRTQHDKRWFSRETFEGLMRIRGIECASPTGYAEGFYARKITLTLE